MLTTRFYAGIEARGLSLRKGLTKAFRHKIYFTRISATDQPNQREVETNEVKGHNKVLKWDRPVAMYVSIWAI